MYVKTLFYSIFKKIEIIIRLLHQELFIRILLKRKPNNSKRYKISICGIFKNEGLFLKEWIEYNHMIGVEHFYLYNNNSDDNYIEVLTPYIEKRLVTLIDFPYDHAQIKAYQHFYETYRHETQWVSFLDIDEFFVPISHNSLNEWIKGYEKYPVIQIYWKMFGTSGLMKHDNNKLVIEQYHVSWKTIYDCGKCLINTDYEIVCYDTATHHGPIVYYPFMGLKFKVRPINVFRRSALGEGTYFSFGVDMYFASAPITVLVEKVILDLFSNKFAALIPATNPELIDSTYPSTPVICPAKYIFLFFFKLYVSSNSFVEFMYVFLCITPYFENSAFSNPGIILNTLFCSPNFKFV